MCAGENGTLVAVPVEDDDDPDEDDEDDGTPVSGLAAASGSEWWAVDASNLTLPAGSGAGSDDAAGDGGRLTSLERVKNDRSSTRLLRSPCCQTHPRSHQSPHKRLWGFKRRRTR